MYNMLKIVSDEGKFKKKKKMLNLFYLNTYF